MFPGRSAPLGHVKSAAHEQTGLPSDPAEVVPADIEKDILGGHFSKAGICIKYAVSPEEFDRYCGILLNRGKLTRQIHDRLIAGQLAGALSQAAGALSPEERARRRKRTVMGVGLIVVGVSLHLAGPNHTAIAQYLGMDKGAVAFWTLFGGCLAQGVGCGMVAAAKGYSPLLGALGLLSCIGSLIVLFLPNRGRSGSIVTIPPDNAIAPAAPPAARSEPTHRTDFRCIGCGKDPATNVKDGKRYCNDCLRRLFPDAVTIQRSAAQTPVGGSIVPDHKTLPRGGEIMTDDLITTENLSKELLKSVFDAAFMDASYDKDGDLLIQEKCRCFLFPDQEKRRIRLHTQFGFKPSSSELQRLECANLINKDYILVRAAVGRNNTLLFTYDVSLDGGVSKKALVLLVKRFCSIPHTAVSDYGADIIE